MREMLSGLELEIIGLKNNTGHLFEISNRQNRSDFLKVICTSLEDVKILEYEFNTKNRGLSYPLYCKNELEK